MTPEGKVKAWLKAKLKNDLPGAWFYSPPGGAYGAAGTMDYIGVYEGVPFGVETKADETCSLSEIQKVRIKQFQSAGGIACVMKGKNYARYDALVAAIRKRADEIRGIRLAS